MDADELSDVDTERLADAYVQLEALSETLELLFTETGGESVGALLQEVGANSNEIRELLEARDDADVNELHRLARELDRPSDSR